MIIKRVGPVSCAKIAGLLYAIVGIAIGAAISLITWSGGFGPSHTVGLGGKVGHAAIIIFPILYGGIGFVGTLLGAWLYNLVAGFIGGIEMEVQ